jgi:ABC-type bacteriocin/lantibiotic exporter with double-glycine peptidase domain
MVSCNFSVETVLLEDDILKDMGNDSSIKKLLLLVLAIIIVIALWRTLWYLAGVAIFIFLVYFVYELLKGKL